MFTATCSIETTFTPDAQLPRSKPGQSDHTASPVSSITQDHTVTMFGISLGTVFRTGCLGQCGERSAAMPLARPSACWSDWSRPEFTIAIGTTVAQFGGAGTTPGAFITTDHRARSVGRQCRLALFTLRLHLQHVASFDRGYVMWCPTPGGTEVTTEGGHNLRVSATCRHVAYAAHPTHQDSPASGLVSRCVNDRGERDQVLRNHADEPSVRAVDVGDEEQRDRDSQGQYHQNEQIGAPFAVAEQQVGEHRD